MMSSFISSRLRDIRIARGLTTEQLAASIGVTKQSVSKYERGLSVPSPNVIEKIIQEFNIPRNYLNKEEVINPKGKSILFFRAAKATKNYEVELAEIQSKWGYEILYAINSLGKLTPKNLPLFNGESTVEEKALFLRRYWNLGLGPIENLVALLEGNGIYIFTINISGVHVDAYSQIINEIPIVVINKCKGSSARWRFNIAHELGHLLLHGNVSDSELEDNYDSIEKEANMFAGNFLMPAESFGSSIISSRLDYFIQLKKEWKVSIAAMIYRCNELGIIDKQEMKQLQIQISKRKWRVKEPLDDELEFIQSVFLAEQVKKFVLDNNSAERFINSVRLPIYDLERLCSLKDGYFAQYGVKEGLISENSISKYKQLNLF